MSIRVGSFCSGIAAPERAWSALGWEPQWFSEIDPFACAVLAHHYPGVPNLGDMEAIRGETLRGTVDVVCAGTPCQSFSVAGLRGGMADPRGNLALVFLRLVDAIRPAWVVWENVPGVLSSNGGRDFGSFIGGLGQLGYGFAYRMLDAQHFGVPQRRRRVFVVGRAGDWRGAAAVLFERHSLSGNPAPGRETAERTADGIAGCLNSGGGNGGFRTEPGEHIVGSLTPIPFDTTQITSAENYSNPRAGDPCHPPASGAHPPAVAFDWQSGGDVRLNIADRTSALQACQTPAVAIPIQYAEQLGREKRQNGMGVGDAGAPCYTVERRQVHGILTASAVRRLTPRECERLQGFPDDYTLIPYRGKSAADGPRYRALGNSMAVPVLRWIGGRIAKVSAVLASRNAPERGGPGGKR